MFRRQGPQRRRSTCPVQIARQRSQRLFTETRCFCALWLASRATWTGFSVIRFGSRSRLSLSRTKRNSSRLGFRAAQLDRSSIGSGSLMPWYYVRISTLLTRDKAIAKLAARDHPQPRTASFDSEDRASALSFPRILWCAGVGASHEGTSDLAHHWRGNVRASWVLGFRTCTSSFMDIVLCV